MDVTKISISLVRCFKKTRNNFSTFFRRNRDRKQELEMDWSDKKEADEIDTFAGALRNGHTCKQFFAGSAKVPEM